MMAETQPMPGIASRTEASTRAAGSGLRRWTLRLPFIGRYLETFDFVSYLIILTAYIFYTPDILARGPLAFASWTIAFAGFALSERLEGPFVARGWALAYIAIRIAFATWAIWLNDVGFLTTFLFFIIVPNAWGLGQGLGVASLVMSAVAAFGTMFLIVGASHPEAFVTLLPWLAGLGFVGGTTQLARREQEARERSEALVAELTEAQRRLRAYAEQASELATTQERNRLAREIHDSLGHYLTIINVQLETALALRARDADRADRAVAEAKRLASEALADVRRSVAALRPTALENLSIREAIERQVADFREHSGVAVELAIEGDEGRCSQAAGLALYRAVQEGLTNIRKHAGATRVAVRLHFGPATTELLIADDGRGLPADAPGGPRPDGGGYGLTGLRERMALLGGGLDIRPGPHGGTELRATLPCDGGRG
jgi:signal transduction histidine kinase